MPIISLIAAMSKNHVIGINNTLPWHLPADLQHFKQLTLGHPIAMGRKTFTSIGRALPGRTNIIISRNGFDAPPNCTVVNSIAAAIEFCVNEPELFVIGGAQIYQQAITLADRLYLTEIATEIEGDAHFPDFSKQDWCVTSREQHQNDTYHYDFVVYERISNR
ncbi:MAG: dihydrofolate reductase [Sulfuriferula sp.]|nr:dihydrofolate reductase [Sulfuriferula sp.]